RRGGDDRCPGPHLARRRLRTRRCRGAHDRGRGRRPDPEPAPGSRHRDAAPCGGDPRAGWAARSLSAACARRRARPPHRPYRLGTRGDDPGARLLLRPALALPGRAALLVLVASLIGSTVVVALSPISLGPWMIVAGSLGVIVLCALILPRER